MLTHLIRHGFLVTAAKNAIKAKIRAESSYVKIGNVSKALVKAKNPELVPIKYLPNELSQRLLQNLKWMLQKDNIGQDLFLIGPPGKARRQLAMMYLELTNREVEYIALSRDTTESDIKQRREIRSGSAVYLNQSAVRAAIHGRVLVLEGIERAERNVLPVLNNLLENREMQLEDGRFLMSAHRFDELSEKYGPEILERLQLVRCDEHFRVIALGLPTPKFRGNPLDPPLRSRFQARHVSTMENFEELFERARALYPNVSPERIMRLSSLAHAVNAEEADLVKLPYFPIDNLPLAFQILNHYPSLTDSQVLQRLYLPQYMLNSEQEKLFLEFQEKFGFSPREKASTATISSITQSQDVADAGKCSEIVLKSQDRVLGQRVTFPVQTGSRKVSTEPSSSDDFISTPRLEGILAEMALSHSVGDFCLVAPKGSGKTSLVREFARRFGYPVDPLYLYADMSARDLLQQRMTHPVTGDTTWRHSPLIEAALQGRLVLLEGLHNVNPGTLAVLYRLLGDRELDLFDGTRLLRQDRFDALKTATGSSTEELKDKGILPIDPRFRIIALAQPPTKPVSTKTTATSSSTSALAPPPAKSSVATANWLTPELLSGFLFHSLTAISRTEEEEILCRRVPHCDPQLLRPVLDLVHHLRTSEDATERALADNLSTRQLLRIAQKLANFPQDTLADAVRQACLYRFLPRTAANALDQALKEYGILDQPVATEPLTCEIQQGMLSIGSVTIPVQPPMDTGIKEISTEEVVTPSGLDAVSTPTEELIDSLSKIPKTLFYDSQQHLRVMEAMLKDWVSDARQHILLVGNQGVGKNKIVDRILHLMARPREYIQLHRDTTVHSLVMHSAIKDRQLVFEDSPLLKAVLKGHVLVVDEADKAPTQVTCVLRTLVLGGEMQLPDGRRIVPPGTAVDPGCEGKYLEMHPHFRMLVLANRPGFPFLGNDFFAVMGDAFSSHVVENPDPDSEVHMLHKYGPNVPLPLLHKLVNLFGDLRAMAEEGSIQYPYSTRELVNVVKHMNTYPSDGLATVLRNVFDFDAYSKEMQVTLNEVFHRHGVPLISADKVAESVHLAKKFPLGEVRTLGEWRIRQDSQDYKVLRVNTENHSIKFKGPAYLKKDVIDVGHKYHRTSQFTELERQLHIPLQEYNIIGDADVAFAPDPLKPSDAPASTRLRRHDLLHVATLNPISLVSMNLDNPLGFTAHAHGINVRGSQSIDLDGLFPPAAATSFKPRVTIAALGIPYEDCVLLHEASLNVLYRLNVSNAEITRIFTNTFSEQKVTRPALWGRSTPAESFYRMEKTFAQHFPESFVCFYQAGNPSIEVYHIVENSWHSVKLPFGVRRLLLLDPNRWLVEVQSSNEASDTVSKTQYLLQRQDFFSREYTLHPIQVMPESGQPAQPFVSYMTHDSVNMSDSHSPDSTAPNRWAFNATREILGFYNFPTPKDGEDSTVVSIPLTANEGPEKPPSSVVSKYLRDHECLPHLGLLFRTIPLIDCPDEVRQSASGTMEEALQVVNIPQRHVQYLPVPRATTRGAVISWFKEYVPPVLVRRASSVMTMLSPETGATSNSATDITPGAFRAKEFDLLTVNTTTGHVLVWQLTPGRVESALSEWQRMIDSETRDSNLQEGTKDGAAGSSRKLLLERKLENADLNLSGPKVGRSDPHNMPHVGGNTWSGGTGGRDTAGLGGVGGPFRLDAGHDVHQLPDSVKEQVPAHIRQAAREMGQKAWRQRLREIEMSEYDAELYEGYASKVRPQIRQIGNLLENLQARSKERHWVRNQTEGDLDEGKLVEGLLGERAVYKRRANKEPEPGSPQQKPKVMRIVVDVSGSMYRFNGHDQRLVRQLEAILMLLEACAAMPDLESKLCLEIYGHSGEGPQFPFVKATYDGQRYTSAATYANEKLRLNILKSMLAHAQFCISGDHTLDALRVGQEALQKVDWADEKFLLLFSDANLNRYGIHPSQLSRYLTKGGTGADHNSDHDQPVNTYAIFIGSLGDQAEWLAKHLPAGHSFVCLENKRLPQIIQQIFEDTVLKSI